MRMGSRGKQKGAVAVVVALSLVFLLSIAALAIDVGNLLVARNELQNAADAAAMAGAACLYKRTECNNTTATEPDWSDAQALAASFATGSSPTTNLVQSSAVKVVSTASGYWNVTGTPTGLETPGTFAPGNNDMPAVQVTVAKDSSNANGGIPTFLAGVMGINILKASATATAVISRPGYVGPGGLFPFALSQCMYSNFWNSLANSPLTYQTGNAPISGQSETQTIGQPYVFDIGSSYHAGSCTTGQWTTFNSSGSPQSAKNAKNLITSGSPVSLAIGDPTWIQSGTEDTLFHAAQACSDLPNGDGSCAWVTIPVVNSLTPQGQNQTIVAFACLHILNEVGNGINAHLVVRMSADQSKCMTGNSGGVGPNYGAITPPRLVQ